MCHDNDDPKEEIQPSPIYIHTPISGTTDFAQEQYSSKFAVDKPKEDQYPNRTDTAGNTEFYGKKRR